MDPRSDIAPNRFQPIRCGLRSVRCAITGRRSRTSPSTSASSPDSAKRTFAFSLWLEHVGLARDNLTRHISSRPDPVVVRFVAEAESCINVITCNDNDEEEEMGSVPFTASLAADERFGLRFLVVHRNMVQKGVVCMLDGVCGVIFDEGNLARNLLRRDDVLSVHCGGALIEASFHYGLSVHLINDCLSNSTSV
ncbi:hypothetical protein QJS10_CPA06g01380 [Acorus calamus]|uniref:Uncharacterized protein n=1 Tax=Acorus calamus TaxID=4465 RepID=A0AAV9EIP4_ACOCL|nr:hypothetical protein QJS10_CPA06g01380 [Acorus calamus]